jgi:threonine/homoserine/homoserine lactone efflux protein
MLSTRHQVAFVLTSAALIAVPGPSVPFAVSRALVLGRRGGLATVVGNAAGTYVLVVAVAAGVGGVVDRSIVFFAAILPQFVDQSRGNVPVQLLSLGAVFLGIALVSDSAWALTAGAARDWLGRSPRRTSLIGGTGGLIMIGIGGRLLLTGQHDSP